MAKLNLLVIFGGRTVEHDVSIITAQQLMDNADTDKYNIIPLYITREGDWYTGGKLRDVEFFKNFDKNDKALTRVYLSPVAGSGELLSFPEGGFQFFGGKKNLGKVDVVIPAMHGMNGEDGTLQGLLELANIPYTSAGVLGSSVGMDKIVMKMVFKGNGFPVLDFYAFDRGAWESGKEDVLKGIEEKLSYPLFVKPANLGSSIGIGKAKDREGLMQAIEVAVHYDRRILVERAVQDLTEINCSVLGFGTDVKASVCEQPVSWEEFLTFDEKYMRSEASKGMQSLARQIPAPIPDELTREIQELSVKVFKALECKGVVRIDYMIDKETNTLYLNEINIIPGSFAFYLWEPLGIPFKKLIDLLVEYAFKAHQERNKSIYAFDSSLLKKFKKGSKMKK